MITTCTLTVRGPVARAAVEAMRARFAVRVTATGGDTVLTLVDADQAAVRAAMTLLWDSGHRVVAMST